jgi:hypothetical protein
MVFFLHREIGYIKTALCSQHYIILTQWVSFCVTCIQFLWYSPKFQAQILTDWKEKRCRQLTEGNRTHRQSVSWSDTNTFRNIIHWIHKPKAHWVVLQTDKDIAYISRPDAHPSTSRNQHTKSWIFNKLHTSKESILILQSHLNNEYPFP